MKTIVSGYARRGQSWASKGAEYPVKIFQAGTLNVRDQGEKNTRQGSPSGAMPRAQIR